MPDTFEGELRRSVENLEAVLGGAGLTLRDVVKVTAYLADSAVLGERNRIYATLFPILRPARATLTTCLSAIKFELDAIAVVAPTP